MAVTVTYDNEISLSLIYSTTSGGTVFSADRAGITAFDLFANNCVVNDAIYFGAGVNGAFHDMKFYVGTAFAATSVTFVWEYWNGSAWAALTVTDNTAGFTNLGENWVTWTRPADWAYCSVNGSSASLYGWVRCRISVINTPTEGGAQSTQVIKTKDLALTVSGGTSGTPATFTDIYNADVAAGWGIFSRFGSDNLCFETKARLIFNDYFTETGKILIFADGIFFIDFSYGMYCNADSVVTFGTLSDEARRITVDGVQFFVAETTRVISFLTGSNPTSTINLYSCAVKTTGSTRCNITSISRAWNCFFDRAGFRDVRTGVTDIFNCIQCASSESIASAPLSVDTFIAVGATVCGPPPNSTIYIKNCKVRHTAEEITSWAATSSQQCHLVNLDAIWSEFNISWGGSPTGGEIYRDYDIYLKVIDKNNIALSEATILLTDKDGNTVLSCFTNPDGWLNRDYGTATSGTTTTLTDTNKAWTTNQWKGHDILITSGTGSGQRTTIASNTETVLTFATLSTAPDSTSKYVIIPIITNCKWNYLNGTTPSATYNDHTLKIDKSGYYFRPMKLTIDKKIDNVISLERVLNNNFSKRIKINTK